MAKTSYQRRRPRGKTAAKRAKRPKTRDPRIKNPAYISSQAIQEGTLFTKSVNGYPLSNYSMTKNQDNPLSQAFLSHHIQSQTNLANVYSQTQNFWQAKPPEFAERPFTPGSQVPQMTSNGSQNRFR